jgi:uncharacterized protein YndB with AHSA1/START domain
MSPTALPLTTQQIVVDELFPHAPELIWRALTTGALIERWLPMSPTGFEAIPGKRFTFKTKPAGEWDGTIDCEVLEVVPQQRLSYSWRSGHPGNVGYGAPLDTVVSWSLSGSSQGTRLRLVHAGFVAPKNDTAYQSMRQGWTQVLATLGQVAGNTH